jgi:hypothetical protein
MPIAPTPFSPQVEYPYLANALSQSTTGLDRFEEKTRNSRLMQALAMLLAV